MLINLLQEKRLQFGTGKKRKKINLTQQALKSATRGRQILEYIWQVLSTTGYKGLLVASFDRQTSDVTLRNLKIENFKNNLCDVVH